MGTHADKLPKRDRKPLAKEMEQLYPAPTNQKVNRSQIYGHFTVVLSEKGGAGQFELKNKLLDIALSHPKIGVGNVSVPTSFVMMQNELQGLKEKSPYLYWQKYAEIAEGVGNTFLIALWCTDFPRWQESKSLNCQA